MRLRSAPVLAAGAAGLGGAGLTADVLHHGLATRLDAAVHDAVAAHLDGPALRAVLTGVSLAGNRGLAVLPLLVLAGLAARRHATVRPVVVVAGALAATALSVWLVKVGVGRRFPGPGGDGVHTAGLSFPSGHAVNAVVCWGLTLNYAASLGARLRAALPPHRQAILTAVLAGATGLAMVALDYHWLSDVVAGWLLGTVLLVGVLAVGPVHGRRVSPLGPPHRQARPAPARPAPSA